MAPMNRDGRSNRLRMALLGTSVNESACVPRWHDTPFSRYAGHVLRVRVEALAQSHPHALRRDLAFTSVHSDLIASHLSLGLMGYASIPHT